MNSLGLYLDPLLFNALPYVAFFVFFLVTIRRYRLRAFTYSSLSSQFLENRQHFWGLVPFHYGILVVLTGHLVAFLVPRWILLWNSDPLRLYILEASALVFGMLTVVGLGAAVVRRITVSKVKVVTSPMDWVLLALLIIEVVAGVAVALVHPWGSSWFAATAAPYLWSLLTLNPDISYVTPMPWLVKLHIINAYLLILLFPFTRLVHILVAPTPYLWRKPQVVRWYRMPVRH
jgi:nitrate reductase gamma subunit